MVDENEELPELLPPELVAELTGWTVEDVHVHAGILPGVWSPKTCRLKYVPRSQLWRWLEAARPRRERRRAQASDAWWSASQ